MGRTPEFRQDAPLFEAIRNDPHLAAVKLIAEPWDIGGGYQVGNFPPLFAEWNDHFRDARRWLQQSVSLGEFARRFAASSDLFSRNGRQPAAAVNLITAHDGFTLRDCVCFNQKHNEANGEENRDGTNNNYSSNHGIEEQEAVLMCLNGVGTAFMPCSRRCCWHRARRCCWRVTSMVIASTATITPIVRTTH
jgi:glycogen operon protein